MQYYNQEDFPDSNKYQCPPKNAKQYEGTIYRFSKKVNKKTDREDWISVSKNVKNTTYKVWKKKKKYELMCQSAGYSCYRTEIEAKKAHIQILRDNKGAKKFKSFFSVEVKKIDGVLLDTTNPKKNYKHYTYWLSCNSNIPTEHFQVTKF